MAYETSLLIVIFSFCSYVLMRIKKLEIFAILVSIAPLLFYSSKDFNVIPYLLIASLCTISRRRENIPSMVCFISIWALAHMPLEIELLTYYIALTLSKQTTHKRSFDMILPLGLCVTLVTAQYAFIEKSPLVSFACPIMMMILWHHLFLVDHSFKSSNLIEGQSLFQMSILAYLLPLKLSGVMGQATTYVNPTMLNFGLWSFMTLSVLFVIWTLIRGKQKERISLVCSIMRALVLLPLWSGEEIDVRLYLLTLLFVEVIGQLILSFVSQAKKSRAEIGLRLVILGFLYQFLFLRGSLGALVLAEITEYEQKHIDLIWKIAPLFFVVAILVTTISLFIDLNREIKASSPRYI